MGMYTELRVCCRLRRDVPDSVVKVLRYLSDGNTMKPPFELPEHPLFACRRWSSLMRMGSAYFPDNPSAAVVKFNGQWSVLSNANLKNYDGEIGKFVDWLRPFVEAAPGEVWATSQYEEDDAAKPITA